MKNLNSRRPLMVTGPWKDTYNEYNPTTGEMIVSTHGRKEIFRSSFHQTKKINNNSNAVVRSS